MKEQWKSWQLLRTILKNLETDLVDTMLETQVCIELVSFCIKNKLKLKKKDYTEMKKAVGRGLSV